MWKRIRLVTLVRGAEKVLRGGRCENGIKVRISYCESGYGSGGEQGNQIRDVLSDINQAGYKVHSQETAEKNGGCSTY